MTAPHLGTITTLGYFVLARMLVPSKKGHPPASIEKCLAPYFASRLCLSKGDWSDLVKATLRELNSLSLIAGKSATPAGKTAACQYWNIPDAVRPAKWDEIQSRYFFARALSLAPRDAGEWKAVGDSNRVCGIFLACKFCLRIGKYPTTAQALDALAWKQLEAVHEPSERFKGSFTRDNLFRALFTDGAKNAPGPLMVAKFTQASSTKTKDLRVAIVRQWLDQLEGRAVVTGKMTLSAFADRVLSLASQATDGRFGDHKVFISHVWSRFKASPEGRGFSRTEFDERLVDSNRQGLLKLSRADLVGAMNPHDVASSEIKLDHASFHLIRTDE